MGEVEIINGKRYFLKYVEDNSAPCSNCAFFNRGSGDICKHPNKSQRMCYNEIGTNKGWNTMEYKLLW